MAKLVWDKSGERFYENGVSKGVLYPKVETAYPKGVAWNGLTTINESPEGAEPTDLYADNIKYASMRSAETFGGTIEAYMYPDEWNACDGNVEAETGVYIGQQERQSFGLSYVTNIGSDSDSDAGYKIHLVYGATASPSEVSRETINDSPDAATMSWEFDTTPESVTGHKPTSHLVIDSRKADPTKLAELEKKLYGDDSAGEPQLPLPDEVIAMMAAE